MSLTHVGKSLAMYLAGLVFRFRASRSRSLEELVKVAFDSRVGPIGIRPTQIREEILEFLKLVKSLNLSLSTVLEIGTGYGGTLFLLSWIANDDATLITIDLPKGPFGGGYPLYRQYLYRAFIKPSQRLHLLLGDSHDPRTLSKIRKLLNGRCLDLIFIDGDHTYRGVKKDYEMYSPLLCDKGVIAFHDIVPGPEQLVGGVPRFWKEVKNSISNAKIVEIVKDWDQGGFGIGVIIRSS